jgi:hypothetical protein
VQWQAATVNIGEQTGQPQVSELSLNLGDLLGIL